MLQVCQAYGIQYLGTVEEQRLVSTTFLDLTQLQGVRFQMYIRHSIRGLQENVLVHCRLKEIPGMWYRDAEMALPSDLLQGPIPEQKVGERTIFGLTG